MMNFNVDECKINANKIYINGWAHYQDYEIKIQCNQEEKKVDHFVSRYDICMLFHEKIEENQYGFQQELSFQQAIKTAKIYLLTKDEEQVILKVDQRKLMVFLKKIKKLLGKIKRGICFLWREYHFLVPPTMIKKYIGMIFSKGEKAPFYNPEIESEYESWLKQQKYGAVEEKKQICIVSNTVDDFIDIVVDKSENFQQKIQKIQEEYVLLIEGKVKLEASFFQEMNQIFKEKNDLVYFDNDFIKDGKYTSPILKPDWSYDTLLGVNYIGNCFLVRTSLLKKMKIDSLSCYKILLNLSQLPIRRRHLSKILYHDYGKIQNEKTALKAYLKQQKIKADIQTNPDGVTNTLYYQLEEKPLISILIPTKDHVDILEQCLKSIYEKTTYKNYEIIVIDNNSCEPETFALLKQYEKKKNFTVKRLECPFNYSYLNNVAVQLAKGEYLVLLNNDIEVITPNWLEIMLGYAMQKHIGTVGVKLLFPDETIQHAGIIMGKGGLAGHAYYGKPKNYISRQYELKIPYNYSACTAACLMISKKKYLEVGGLEEQLQVAFNDVDFNLKMLEKGYANLFLPCVEIYHYESKSRGLDTTSEKQKRFIKEWSFIVDKWGKYIEHDPYYNDNFSKNDDYMLK